MRHYSDDDARQRAARARQVISGAELGGEGLGATRPVAFQEESSLSNAQWIYFGVLAGLVALSLILYVIFGGGVASVFFFLLALLLFAGWFVF